MSSFLLPPTLLHHVHQRGSILHGSCLQPLSCWPDCKGCTGLIPSLAYWLPISSGVYLILLILCIYVYHMNIAVINFVLRTVKKKKSETNDQPSVSLSLESCALLRTFSCQQMLQVFRHPNLHIISILYNNGVIEVVKKQVYKVYGFLRDRCYTLVAVS